jgi:hypothetical protein
MKKFLTTGVMVATMVLLLGASQLMQAQSGVPEGASASNLGPQATAVNCTPTPKVSWAASNGNETASTTSTAFVDVPGLSVTFNVPGTAVTCLKVDLTVMSFASANHELMFMQVLVDGNPILPGQVQWSGDDGIFARAHAANFYTTVAPGVHNVRAQFRSNGGNTVFAHARSLSVNHK